MKISTKVTFHRPWTLNKERNPKYERINVTSQEQA
ncbi:60S ribosomal protein L23a [Linum perenne]